MNNSYENNEILIEWKNQVKDYLNGQNSDFSLKKLSNNLNENKIISFMKQIIKKNNLTEENAKIYLETLKLYLDSLKNVENKSKIIIKFFFKINKFFWKILLF